MLRPLVDLWSTSLTTRQSWCKHRSALAARSLFPTKGRLPVAFPSPSGDIPAVRGRCDCKSTKQNIIKRIWNVMCFYTLFNVSSAGFIAGRIVLCSCFNTSASFKENFSNQVRSRLRQGQRLSATRSETICDKVRRRLWQGQRLSVAAQLGHWRVLHQSPRLLCANVGGHASQRDTCHVFATIVVTLYFQDRSAIL